MLSFFADLWRVVSLFMAAVAGLAWVLAFTILMLFLFAMFTIVLIGRQLEYPAPDVPAASAGGLSNVQYKKDYSEWRTLDTSVATFKHTNTAMLAMFRIMVYDGNLAFTIMEKEAWTYAWFLLYIAVARVLLTNLLRVMVLEAGARGTAGEVFSGQERALGAEIADCSNKLVFDGNRQLTYSNWCKNAVLCPSVLKVVQKLGLKSTEIAIIFPALFDPKGTGSCSYTDFLVMYFKIKDVTQDPNLLAAITVSGSSFERMWHLRAKLGFDPDADLIDPGIPEDTAQYYGQEIDLNRQLEKAMGKKITKTWSEYTCMQRFVEHPLFDGIMGIIVMANSIFMAVEYQYPDDEAEAMWFFWMAADMIFLVIFIWEVMMRMIAWSIMGVLRTPALSLDVFIVGSGVLTDIVIPLLTVGLFVKADKAGGGALGAVQLLKVLRVLRAIRVLRLLTMFADLWRVVQLFQGALKVIFWTMAFILIIVFIFALFSVVIIGRREDMRMPAPEDDGGQDYPFLLKEWELYEAAIDNFKFTNTAILAMFRMMFYDGWVAVRIMEKKAWTYAWFVAYVAISKFTLGNLIVAMMLENVRKTSVEPLLEDASHKMSLSMKDMATVFDITEDQRIVTVERWVSQVRYHVGMYSVIKSMHLQDDDLKGIFKLCDADGNGTVEYHELVDTYGRLKNAATNAQLTTAIQTSVSKKERLQHLARALGKKNDAGKQLASEMDEAKKIVDQLRASGQLIDLLPGEDPEKAREQSEKIQKAELDELMKMDKLPGAVNRK
jgi:hypothetical protein